MAELKTKPTTASVGAFLKNIENPARRRDCVTVKRIMERVTRGKARMWGTSIVGFGVYKYRYPSGQTGEWMLTGFSPRKQNLTLYIMAGFGFQKDLMRQLGTKHSTGKSCLYIKTLADVDLKVLERLIRSSVKHMKARSA
jgi:hypothetical protein